MTNPTPSDLRAQLKAVTEKYDRQFTQQSADSKAAFEAMRPIAALMDGPSLAALHSAQRVDLTILNERTKCLLECINIAQGAVYELEGYIDASANLLADRNTEIKALKAQLEEQKNQTAYRDQEINALKRYNSEQGQPP
jgi:activator of 2-hydroxyglutaryl-CoA dehydratase